MEVQQGVAATLRFPEAGADPAAFTTDPTITVTRDSDGSTVVAAGETTKVVDGEETHWTFDLTGSDLPEVDLLRVVWADEGSSYTTEVEIVGGFVTPLAAITDKLGETKTTDELFRAREVALREIEDACGVAFRPRYAKERVDGRGEGRVLLQRRRLLKVLGAEVDGTALEVGEVEGLTLDPIGVVVRTAGWPRGRGNLVFAYAHGYTTYTPAVQPVRDLAAYLLTRHPNDWNERATAMSTEAGTYSLVTPGVRGALFPLPSVNAFVSRHGTPLVA